MQTNTLSSELAMSADGSLQQQCAEMGALLGLDAPVSEAVLKAALADTTYAHHLLVSRGSPFMAHLLDHPPVVIVNEAEEFTTSALLMRAGSALARWGKTGFSTVSDEQYRDRLALCQNCPHLKVPPEHQHTLYAFAGASNGEKSVCGKCGCVVAAKARRPNETCPDAHPERPGLNRWNEPVAQVN